MLNYYITPGAALAGEIQVPGDKSISHRSLMLSAIAEGTTHIKGFLMGADNLATMKAFQALGVEIQIKNNQEVIVKGVGKKGLKKPTKTIDLENSGTAIRLMTGLLAGQSFDSELTGDESLRHRPMKRVVDPLRQMGAQIETNEKMTPPLKIKGNCSLTGIEYVLPMASAQVKSCLLLAGLYAEGKTTIVEPSPTRDHTERLLKLFHYPITVENNRMTVTGGKNLIATNIEIPGDISSAAFFIVAATITPGSDITLKKVGLNPTRTGVIDLLKMMGADIQIIHKVESAEPIGDLRIRYAPLRGIEIPENQIASAIDEFPIVLIAAATAKGKTILKGAAELRVKETDRIAAMHEGLEAVGIASEMLSDGIIVSGGIFQGGEIKSFGDHRIAMAFSIAGHIAKAPIIVHDCDNVQTSFPNFTELANQMGLQIKKVKT